MEQIGALASEWRGVTDNEAAAAARDQTRPATDVELECRLGELPDGRSFAAGITQSDAERACTTMERLLRSVPVPAGKPTDSKTAVDNNTWTSAVADRPDRRIIRAEESRIEDVGHASTSAANNNELRARTTTVIRTEAAPGLPTPPVPTISSWHVVSKERLAYVDVRVLQRKYDCRFGLKREQAVRNPSAPLGPAISRRSQLRRSFWTSDGCRIDLSAVATYDGPTIGTGGRTTFEAEIEVVDPKTAPDDAVSSMVYWLLVLQSCFARPATCDAVGGRILFVRMDTDKPSSSSSKTESEATSTDVLLVSVSRNVCRFSK